jgi:hypothetical protein
MHLSNLTVITATQMGCLPASMLSGDTVNSLQLLLSPASEHFPNSQKALLCPLPAFPTEKGGSAEPYASIKKMQKLSIRGSTAVLDLASLGCAADGCDSLASSMHYHVLFAARNLRQGWKSVDSVVLSSYHCQQRPNISSRHVVLRFQLFLL